MPSRRPLNSGPAAVLSSKSPLIAPSPVAGLLVAAEVSAPRVFRPCFYVCNARLSTAVRKAAAKRFVAVSLISRVVPLPRQLCVPPKYMLPLLSPDTSLPRKLAVPESPS